MPRWICLVSVGFLACEPGVITTLPIDMPTPPMAVVEGSGRVQTALERTAEDVFSSPGALWVQRGAVVVSDADGVHVRSGPATFAPLPVGTEDSAQTVGQVRSVTERATGVLVAASAGFFLDGEGRLLRSPLSDSFTLSTVRWVDAVGAGADEVLWVTSVDEVDRVADGRKEAVVVSDAREEGALQVAVGEGEAQALVIRGASLYRVDTAQRTLAVLARGVGRVSSFVRRAEGVWLGTNAGLLKVAPNGNVTQYTLAAAGEDPADVLEVVADDDGVVVTTATRVLRLAGVTAVVLAEGVKPVRHGLGRDPSGELFLFDGPELVRLSRSTAPLPTPSFATDVKPLFAAYCRSCHSSGANYAPVIDFESYAAAKRWAPVTERRLRDTNAPMPPAASAVLAATELDLVSRWISGGMQP